MTSSYDKRLLNAMGAPPTVSETNYLKTEVDLVEKVNAQIDRNQDALNASFDSLIRAYNSQHNATKDRFQDILRVAGNAKNVYWRAKEFAKDQKKWNQFESNLRSLDKDNNGIPDAIVKNSELLGTIDEDINAENNIKAAWTENKTEREDIAGYLTRIGDGEGAALMSEGQDGSDLTELYRAETHEQIKENWELWYNRATKGDALLINFSLLNGIFDQDGNPNIKPASEAFGWEEKAFRDRIVLHMYLQQNEQFTLGRPGKYKKDVVVPLMGDLERKSLLAREEDNKAFIEVSEERRGKALFLELNKDPQAYINWVNMYKGAYDGSFKIAKKEGAKILARYGEQGLIPRHVINKILDTPFEARDPNAGPNKDGIVTVREYWKPEAKIIKEGVQKFERNEYEARKEEVTAKQKALATEVYDKVVNQKEPLSIDQVNSLLRDFKVKTGITDDRYLPEILKNLPYAGIETDIELDNALSERWHNGENITRADLMGFEDPTFKDKWWDKVDKGGLEGQAGKDRESFITGKVNKKTLENDGNKDKSDKWRAYQYNARRAFNDAYVRARETGANHREAFKEGMTAVEEGLQNDDWADWGGTPQDLTKVSNLQKAKDALVKEPTLINSSTPWPGEQEALLEAAKSYEDGSYKIPTYYTLFPSIKASPLQIMKHRLEATGILKEGKIEIPEEVNLKPSQAQLVTNKVTPSRTYRVTQENKDIVWMLEQVQDKNAATPENGGYVAIKDKNGDYVKLDKPLTEHSIAEVITLINEGYTDFGMFGITSAGLQSVIRESPISLSDTFDGATQDLLILTRLRQKARQAQKYSTLTDQYRRLVNINPADEKQFLEVVGELPPYLRLSNLLPAVATEMVNQTLQ